MRTDVCVLAIKLFSLPALIALAMLGIDDDFCEHREYSTRNMNCHSWIRG